MELKNGVTFNGHLVECDNYMNVTLREVYQTSADGERFWKMKEMFIKGNVVRLLSLLNTSLHLLPFYSKTRLDAQRALNRADDIRSNTSE